MLTDALDHITFEEPTEEFLKQVIEKSDNPVAVKFAEEGLEEWQLEEEEDYDYDDEDYDDEDYDDEE